MEDDAERIATHRQEAINLDGILRRVEARGGPRIFFERLQPQRIGTVEVQIRCSAKDDPGCSSQHVEGRMRRSVTAALATVRSGDLQQKVHVDGVIREDDAPIRRLLQHARPQQNMDVAVNRAHITASPPRNLANRQ